MTDANIQEHGTIYLKEVAALPDSAQPADGEEHRATDSAEQSVASSAALCVLGNPMEVASTVAPAAALSVVSNTVAATMGFHDVPMALDTRPAQSQDCEDGDLITIPPSVDLLVQDGDATEGDEATGELKCSPG